MVNSLIELRVRVDEVARTIEDCFEKAEALRDVSTALARVQQWTEAERVISTIKDRTERVKALNVLATLKATTDEIEQIFHFMQHLWYQAIRLRREKRLLYFYP